MLMTCIDRGCGSRKPERRPLHDTSARWHRAEYCASASSMEALCPAQVRSAARLLSAWRVPLESCSDEKTRLRRGTVPFATKKAERSGLPDVAHFPLAKDILRNHLDGGSALDTVNCRDSLVREIDNELV